MQRYCWHFSLPKLGMAFRIITQMGCGESFEGVAVAADMFHLQQVKAFIGPYCNAGIISTIFFCILLI